MNTTHYDFTNIGSTQLVLDAWKNQATIIDNDVIPASKECPVISGIENPSNSLGMTSGQAFTTLPLYPLAKDVNFIFQNYINIRMKLKVKLTKGDAWVAGNDEMKHLAYAVFFPSTACIPSRIQLLCGNSSIWNNSHQRIEARITQASLPNAITDKSPDYFAINKLVRRQSFPGFWLWHPGDDGSKVIQTSTTELVKEVELNLNIDLNQLTPLMSNIPFVTHEMGELRLRLFIEDLHKALCWAVIPATDDSNIKYSITEVIPFDEAYTIGGKVITASLMDWDTSVGGISIVQSCFAINEESKAAIKQYIAQDNKITIPTQTWSTAFATSRFVNPHSDVIFQISAYNVNILALLFPFYNSDVVFPNPIFKYLDVKFNSKTVNYIPYGQGDLRMYKDTVQALVNDDCSGANTNLIESLKPTYLDNYTGSPDSVTAVGKRLDFNVQKLRYHYRNPNNFMVAFGVSPVNTFEKGFNMASSNPGSTQIRVTAEVESDRKSMFVNGNQTFYASFSDKQKGDKCKPPVCACLCDCCLVLDYNPVVGRAQSGCIVYAEPTLA